MTPQELNGPQHIDPSDPKYAISAGGILDRHNRNEPEANITSAVRDFLILTGLAQAVEAAAAGATKQLEQLRKERDNLTVTVARRELRKWLRESAEGKAVEAAVGKLLGVGASS